MRMKFFYFLKLKVVMCVLYAPFENCPIIFILVLQNKILNILEKHSQDAINSFHFNDTAIKQTFQTNTSVITPFLVLQSNIQVTSSHIILFIRLCIRLMYKASIQVIYHLIYQAMYQANIQVIYHLIIFIHDILKTNLLPLMYHECRCFQF